MLALILAVSAVIIMLLQSQGNAQQDIITWNEAKLQKVACAAPPACMTSAAADLHRQLLTPACTLHLRANNDFLIEAN